MAAVELQCRLSNSRREMNEVRSMVLDVIAAPQADVVDIGRASQAGTEQLELLMEMQRTLENEVERLTEEQMQLTVERSALEEWIEGRLVPDMIAIVDEIERTYERTGTRDHEAIQGITALAQATFRAINSLMMLTARLSAKLRLISAEPRKLTLAIATACELLQRMSSGDYG
jgi:chromosome segregation ATPase